ncbi:hypothetical protein IC582_030429 [Cucumis melo]
MHINQIYHHSISLSSNIPTIKSIITLQVVSGEGEQRSTDQRPNCRETNGGAAAWSRCWSQRLIFSYGGADGCGSEENSAGSKHQKTPSLWKSLPEENEVEWV